MNHRHIPLVLLALLAGCDRAPKPEPVVTRTAPPALPARAVTISEETDAIAWRESWPAEVAAIPALDRHLRSRAAESKAEAVKAATAERAEALASGSGPAFNRHSHEQRWQVQGSTPKLLSLVGAFDEYTGGAHGISGWEPLLWDRVAGSPIDFATLFTDAEAAQHILAAAFCPALDVERAKRRGAPVVADPEDPFTQCPDVGDQALVPAGAAAQSFTRIRVLVGPYEAGPFAEGGYEIDVPVTAEFTALLRPAYRDAFSASR
jgi:hypothetical protein